MKKINYLFALSIMIMLNSSLFAQETDLRNAYVNGIIAIGNNDIASIILLENGTLYKTATFERGLLNTNQTIQLDFTNDPSLASAHVAGLSANVTAFLQNNENSSQNDYELNPYEIEGIIHNLTIQPVVDDPNFSNMSQEDIFETMNIEYDRLSGEMNLEAEAELSFEETAAYFNDYNDNPISNLEAEINRYEGKVKINLQRIISLPGESSNVTNFSERVAELTTELVRDESLSANDKKTLLGTLAVTDYSVRFWNERGSVVFGDPLGSDIERRRKRVWLHDTGGFLLGIFILRPRAVARFYSAVARL